MLQKQVIDISFAQGLDTKTDPFRVAPGKFSSLQNSIFDKIGRLTKRNGFSKLPSLPDTTSTYLTTFNGNLTAIGDKLEAYSSGSNAWANKGYIQPLDLSTLSLIRSSTNQSQADAIVSSTGLACTVYTDQVPNTPFGGFTNLYKYSISDSTTSQNIVFPTTIDPDCAFSPRVFILGTNFIILYVSLVSNAYHLRYLAISTTNPTATVGPTDLSTTVLPSSQLNYDAVVANNALYVAWNGSDIGNSIRMTFLNTYLGQGNTVVFSGQNASILSITADTTGSSPVMYVSWYDSSGNDSKTLAVNPALITILNPTTTTSGVTIQNLTSVASDAICRIYIEIANTYGYDTSIPTNYIQNLSISQSGTVVSPTTLIRSVGLASKAFILDGVDYFLSVYSSLYQPSYFMISQMGKVVAKLAYSNASGYYTTGLPGSNVMGETVQFAYLYRDLIQSVNKTQGLVNAQGVYAQTGVNLATCVFNISTLVSAEIGNNLNISGGLLYMYDGYAPVEQNFFVWPDDIELVGISATVSTGTVTSGSPIITSIATAGLSTGMNVSGTHIPGGATVIAVGSNTVTMSANATADGAAEVITFTGNMTNQEYFYQVTYEWADNQGNIHRSAPSIPVSITSTTPTVQVNIPTLRLTYKIQNPVKIVVYRWSTGQQQYYQTTNIANPVANDTTVDYVSFLDTHSDAQILGNNLIYTTGGVVEDISPPATDVMTLFQSRLFLVDAEDRNLLWYSKQVIESTPVEMSDLFTLYVAPTTGAQGSTGSITALAPLDDKLIIFKPNAMAYINGTGPDNTGANNLFSEPYFITSTVGCENQQSIVFMPSGLMFQSDKGIWLLDRSLNTQYIGAPVESLTTGATITSALNIPGTNQVRFSLDTGITLVYDYFYGQWGSFTNVPSISSTLYKGLHTYVNSSGNVYQESIGQYLDGTSPVVMSFTTGWMNFAGFQGFERFYEMLLVGQYISPFKLNVQLSFNFNPAPQQAVIVSPNNYTANYGGNNLWGSGGNWGSSGEGDQEASAQVFEARIFPSTQKVESFQITITEMYDPTIGVPAGAGLTLSGVNLVVGIKKGYRTSKASRSFG